MLNSMAVDLSVSPQILSVFAVCYLKISLGTYIISELASPGDLDLLSLCSYYPNS